jgi:hypothetical protein
MANGTFRTYVDGPSGKIYRAGDKAIEAKDLNFAISAGLSNNRHNSVNLRARDTLASWEAMNVGDGILIKTADSTAFNNRISVALHEPLKPLDKWEDNDYLTYIPFSPLWFEDFDNITVPGIAKEVVEVLVYLHPVEGTTPPNQFKTASELLKEQLTTSPTHTCFSVIRLDREVYEIPQIDCYVNKCSKRICRMKLAKRDTDNAIQLIELENYCVGEHITFDITLKPCDIITYDKEGATQRLFFHFPISPSIPSYFWVVRSMHNNRRLTGTQWTGQVDDLPTLHQFGKITSNFKIDNPSPGTPITYYLRFQADKYKPKNVIITSVAEPTDGDNFTKSFSSYKLYEITIVSNPDGNRIIRFAKYNWPEFRYVPLILTYNALGEPMIVDDVNNSPPNYNSQKVLKFEESNTGQRATIILDWIRASSAPLEIEPISELTPPEYEV